MAVQLCIRSDPPLVVKDAMREGETLSVVAARHGVHPSMVRACRMCPRKKIGQGRARQK